jgi:hypothetical protein
MEPPRCRTSHRHPQPAPLPDRERPDTPAGLGPPVDPHRAVRSRLRQDRSMVRTSGSADWHRPGHIASSCGRPRTEQARSRGTSRRNQLHRTPRRETQPRAVASRDGPMISGPRTFRPVQPCSRPKRMRRRPRAGAASYRATRPARTPHRPTVLDRLRCDLQILKCPGRARTCEAELVKVALAPGRIRVRRTRRFRKS